MSLLLHLRSKMWTLALRGDRPGSAKSNRLRGRYAMQKNRRAAYGSVVGMIQRRRLRDLMVLLEPVLVPRGWVASSSAASTETPLRRRKWDAGCR